MQHVMPEPHPIPPELPLDPAHIPPDEWPVNTPPEKGPRRPEPLPLEPERPRPVARGWCAQDA
jgi:hypothetical protein